MAGVSFSPIRMTAATEEAAVQQALQVVGAQRDEVDVEVLKSDAKGVTVRVGPRRDPAQKTMAAPAESETKAAAKTPRRSSARGAKSGASSAPDEGVQADAGLAATTTQPSDAALSDAALSDFSNAVNVDAEPDNGTADFPESNSQEASKDLFDAPVAAPPTAPRAAPKETTSTPARPIDPAMQEQARALAQDFLDRMGMEAQVEVDAAAMASSSQSSDGAARLLHLQIEGEDVGILIGKHGQTLQAQYLLNVTLNNRPAGEESANGSSGEMPGRESSVRVVVDAGGYRARRAGSLDQSAREAAARALRDRRSVRLEPMPAHERRLVHMALQEDPLVTTSSEGREPLRHVVVSPTGSHSSAPATGGERGQRPSGFGGRGRGGFGSGGSGGGNSGGGSGNRGSGGRGGYGGFGGRSNSRY